MNARKQGWAFAAESGRMSSAGRKRSVDETGVVETTHAPKRLLSEREMAQYFQSMSLETGRSNSNYSVSSSSCSASAGNELLQRSVELESIITEEPAETLVDAGNGLQFFIPNKLWQGIPIVQERFVAR